MTTTLQDAKEAMTVLEGIISPSQFKTLKSLLKGEEKHHFRDKVAELAGRFVMMPKTYEQDGLGKEAIAYLHYFVGGADFYITEKDMEAEQYQAFGLARILPNPYPELGYISIVEITSANAELDFYFKPQTLGEIYKTLGENPE